MGINVVFYQILRLTNMMPGFVMKNLNHFHCQVRAQILAELAMRQELEKQMNNQMRRTG
jgi:hypothetical protein